MPTITPLPEGQRIEQLPGFVPLEIGPATGELAGIREDRSPLSFRQRGQLGIKMTPESKAAFLESLYGQGNVITTKQGEFYIRPPGEKDFFRADPRGFDVGDVAEVGAPLAIEAAPAMLGGANPLLVGAGAAAGAGIREGISAALPGGEPMTAGARAKHVGTTAALAGGAQAGVNLAAKGIGAVRQMPAAVRDVVPKMAGRAYAESLGTPQGAEAALAQMRQGVPLTVGQQTGNRFAVMAEGWARRFPLSADRAFAADQRQLSRFLVRLENIMGKVSPTETGELAAGMQARSAFDTVLEKARELRRNQAKADFALVDESAGKQATIPTDNVLAKIKELTDRYDVPGGGDASAAIVKRLKTVADGLSHEADGVTPKAITAAQAGRLLEIYGEAARGKGAIFKDIETAQQRGIAGQLGAALRQDIDAAAGGGTAAAAALRLARDRYKENSAQINAMSKSVLGQLFKADVQKSPERVADQLLRMKPSELQQSLAIIDKGSPSGGSAVRRYFIENAMAKARPAPSAQAIGAVPFSPAKFLAAMPSDAHMAVLYGGREAAADLKDIVTLLARVPDTAGVATGSQTAPLSAVWDVVKGGLSFDFGRTAGALATLVTPDIIVESMMSNPGRSALRTMITTPKAPTGAAARRVVGAMAYLGALQVAQPAPRDVRRPAADSIYDPRGMFSRQQMARP